MSKYKLSDLKVGAVFKKGDTARTIITAGETHVFYSFRFTFSFGESICRIGEFLSGEKGELVKPTTKIAYVQYWSWFDLSSKKACSKEIWDSRTSTKFDKFIREFEVEVGEDGFPVEGGV